MILHSCRGGGVGERTKYTVCTARPQVAKLRGLFTSKCNAWVWLSAFISSSSAVTHWYLATQQWHQVPKEKHIQYVPYTATSIHPHTNVPPNYRSTSWFLMWSWQLRTNRAHKKIQKNNVDAAHWNVKKGHAPTHTYKSITSDIRWWMNQSEQDARITNTDTHPWQSSHWVKCQQTIQSEKETCVLRVWFSYGMERDVGKLGEEVFVQEIIWTRSGSGDGASALQYRAVSLPSVITGRRNRQIGKSNRG